MGGRWEFSEDEEREQRERLDAVREAAQDVDPDLRRRLDELTSRFMEELAETRESASRRITTGELTRLDDQALLERVDGRLLEVAPDEPSERASLPPLARAYVATRLFEGDVLNGGLHQYFINHDDASYWSELVNGYRLLGLTDIADTIRYDILPVAEEEQSGRAELTNVFRVSKSYELSRLPAFDDLVAERTEEFDRRRVEVVKANPAQFAI